MKNIYFGLSLLIVVAVSSCAGSRVYNQGAYEQHEYAQDYASQDGPITYQQFYDNLSPYGRWMNYRNYGYVWVPDIAGFRPYYTGGQWAYTNYGWTWVSQYNWGWAPFHYGRWLRDMHFGWVWVPGYEWGPAWVSWRGGGDYYGWAPMGPGGNRMGNIPYDNWTFVPGRYINSPRINDYYINRSRNVTIINNTTIINRGTGSNINGRRPAYNPGPSVADVERSTRSKIRQFNVEDAGQPGSSQISNNAIRVYRPAVKTEATNNRSAAPARIFTGREVEANRQNNNTDRPAQRPALPNRNQQNVNTQQNDQPANNSRPRRQVQTPSTQQPSTAPSTRPVREFNKERQMPAASNDQRNTEPITPLIKNEPSRNIPERQPTRQFNTEERPINNRNTNTPPPNAPTRQPARNFDNNGNSGAMRQNTPAVRSAPAQSAERSADSRPGVRRAAGANE